MQEFLQIRKATIHDVVGIVDCLLLAMEPVLFTLMNRQDPAEAKRFMTGFVGKEGNQYSYSNCYVATLGAQVVAAVNVYDGALLHELRKPVLEYLHNNYSDAAMPEDETGAGEIYIDSLGILPEYQRRGIASQLLDFLKTAYCIKQNKVLGLLVDEDNPAARSLYQRAGFRENGNTIFLGKNMLHLQMKPGFNESINE